MRKDNQKPLVLFFFPSRKIGGVEVLYVRLAEFFFNDGYAIGVIDYLDGYIKRELQNKNIEFSFTEYKSLFKSNIEGDFCITSLLHIDKYPELKNLNLKFFFWDDHPQNAIMPFRGIRAINLFGLSFFIFCIKLFQSSRYKKIKNSFRELIDTNQVIFMCRFNFNYNIKLFNLPEGKANIIPIAIPMDESSELLKFNLGIKIRCSYIGRLDSDKFEICEELISDFERYNSNSDSLKLELFVVGGGEKYTTLKEKHESRFVKFMGKVNNHNLQNFFEENQINLAFAIGTSALESAKYGIPTILLRTVTDKRFKFNYLWLNQVFGRELALNYINMDKAVSLESIISMILTDYDPLSEETFRYVIKHHSLKNTYCKLKQVLKK